jgi:hypothetical protein
MLRRRRPESLVVQQPIGCDVSAGSVSAPGMTFALILVENSWLRRKVVAERSGLEIIVGGAAELRAFERIVGAGRCHGQKSGKLRNSIRMFEKS